MIWSFENVQHGINPYPPRGKYDAEPEGMEDEAMEDEENRDPHEKLWEKDSDGQEAKAAAHINSHEEPDPFDPNDWVNPEEAREKLAIS